MNGYCLPLVSGQQDCNFYIYIGLYGGYRTVTQIKLWSVLVKYFVYFKTINLCVSELLSYRSISGVLLVPSTGTTLLVLLAHQMCRFDEPQKIFTPDEEHCEVINIVEELMQECLFLKL